MEDLQHLYHIAEYLEKRKKFEWSKLLRNFIDHIEINLPVSESDTDSEWEPTEWVPEDDCPDSSSEEWDNI